MPVDLKSLIRKGMEIKLQDTYEFAEEINPLILELSETHNDLSLLVRKLTQLDITERASPEFRKIVLEKLLPLLPSLEEVEGIQADFLHRISKKNDELFSSKFKVGDTCIVENAFIAFYLNGQCSGGMTDSGNSIFITENLHNSKFLGPLSQIPSENEVLIPEGTKYQIIGIYDSLEDILNCTKHELGLNTKNYLYNRYQYGAFLSKNEYVVLG